MSVNKVILVGHVGADPLVKTLENGTKVASFTLAMSERGYTTQSGVQVPDRTEWANIVVWKGLAEISEKWIFKGSQIYVEGKLTTRKWEKDGVSNYRTEIVADNIQLLGKKPEETAQQSTYTPQPAQQDVFNPNAPVGSELPF